MTKCVKSLLVSLVVSFSAVAQVIPEPGAKLNYTQVMFEYEKITGAEVYLLQIVEDNGGVLFEKPLIERRDSSTATRISNLQFGKKYLWRYTGIVKGEQLPWKGPYNFETGDINITGRNSFAITILKNDTTGNAGGLVVTDLCAILNRKGEAVWYLPEIRVGNKPISTIRDLRLTPFNTITFLVNIPYAGAYECDLRGNVLWTAPDDGKLSGDTTEYYHHDFQRLLNGNYMILGNKYEWKKVPASFIKLAMRYDSIQHAIPILDSVRRLNPPIQMNPLTQVTNGEMFAKIQFGTIIEYNKKGEIVWSWDSETYLKDDEIFPLLFYNVSPAIQQGVPPGIQQGLPSGIQLGLPPGIQQGVPAGIQQHVPPGIQQGGPPGISDRDAHMNAFSVDAKNEFVYAGFRQLNKVIKIQKQTGKVVNSWDNTTLRDPEALFYHQHSATIRSDGSILVFDNADARVKNKGSRVLALTQPTSESPGKVAFSFDCIFDSVAVKSDRGGNADELPNKNILVSMGMGLIEIGVAASPSPTWMKSRIFEVTPDKKLVWSAVIEKIPQPPYRAHYTSSLYPFYFTVQTDGESFHEKFDLTVFNEGSESDSYTILIHSIKSGFTKQLSSPVVQSGKSKRFEIKPDQLPKADEEMEILVKSNTNLDFERKLFMQFRK